jgi:hypothetical protein
MKIGIGLPTQIRDLDAAIIPRWASRAEDAGFPTLATIGRIAYPEGAGWNRRDVRRTAHTGAGHRRRPAR